MKTRLLAAGVHLLGSAFVISLILSMVYFIWYPEPFYTIHSVFNAVKVAVLVDLVLGPFLTFLVFNLKKPRIELVRDLSVIVVFQIVALSWGVHITYKMRPDFLVFQGAAFYSILQEEIDVDGLVEDVSPPEFWEKPKTVYVEPLSSEDAIKRLDYIMHGGIVEGDMYQSKRYRPLSLQEDNAYRQDVLRHSTDYTELLKSRTWKEKLEQFLLSEGGSGEDYLFYSLENSTLFSGVIIFNKQDFSFAGLME